MTAPPSTSLATRIWTPCGCGAGRRGLPRPRPPFVRPWTGWTRRPITSSPVPLQLFTSGWKGTIRLCSPRSSSACGRAAGPWSAGGGLSRTATFPAGNLSCARGFTASVTSGRNSALPAGWATASTPSATRPRSRRSWPAAACMATSLCARSRTKIPTSRSWRSAGGPMTAAPSPSCAFPETTTPPRRRPSRKRSVTIWRWPRKPRSGTRALPCTALATTVAALRRRFFARSPNGRKTPPGLGWSMRRRMTSSKSRHRTNSPSGNRNSSTTPPAATAP